MVGHTDGGERAIDKREAIPLQLFLLLAAHSIKHTEHVCITFYPNNQNILPPFV